jgi:hypothetical protein
MIGSLQTKFEEVKGEKDKIQTLWLESQKELVDEQSRSHKLQKELEALKVILIDKDKTNCIRRGSR